VTLRLIARSVIRYNPGMRVIITGDRNWNAHELAEAVVKRLIVR
jgi:hypothetical protein